MRGQIKTSVTRNITLTLVHFQRLRARMLQITIQSWTKAYSEERHRKRFPSPHCFMPFYRGTPSWKPEPPQPVVSGVSRKLPQKQSRVPPSPPPQENHMSWSNTETREQFNPQSSHVNVFLLLKYKETFGKNFTEPPGLCVLRVNFRKKILKRGRAIK